VVLPDSHGISRAPCYLGTHSRVARVSPTGVSPSMPMLSNILGYSRDFLLSVRSAALTEWSRYPEHATPASYDTCSVWPVPLSLRLPLDGLTLPHTITRRLILQKARSHFTSARRLITLLRLVGTRVQVLFHDPSPGHFSPLPHGTCSLSVTREYLGLGGGPPGFTRGFSGPVLLGMPFESR